MNIRKNTIIALTFLVVSTVLCGCRVQAQLSDGPVYFVDANSDKSVRPVLVLPHYSWYLDMNKQTRAERKSGISYANPFIYHSDGTPFKVEQPLSTVIIIPFFISIMNKVILLNGVDVYAKGYKVKDVEFRFLIKERPRTFTLEPLGEKESEEEFARISEGLRNKNFEVLLTYTSIQEDTIVDYDFTKKELKMMKDFFAAAPETE